MPSFNSKCMGFEQLHERSLFCIFATPGPGYTLTVNTVTEAFSIQIFLVLYSRCSKRLYWYSDTLIDVVIWS